MAKDKALSTNAEVKRSKQFQDHLDLEHSVVDIVKELLLDQTEKAFSEKGISKNDRPAGVYGTGKAYGFGADEGKYTITIQNKTVTTFTKYVTFGSKRMITDVNCVYEGDVLMVQYKTTEDGNFRGIKEKNGQSYTFHKKFILKTDSLTAIKKTLQSIFLDIAKKEVEYLLNTKLGVQDKLETGTASTVEENLNNNKMKKLTIKELFSDDEMEIISEKKQEVKPNIDKIKKANTVDLNNGNKKRKMFLDDEKSDKDQNETSTVEEITTTAGGPGSAGPFRYDTPYFAAKKSKRPKLDKDYNIVPQKNESFYTRVEIEPGSGYIPKGMKQNYIQGMHNATPEQLAKYGYAEGQFGENKKPDLTKRKIFSESDNIQKGINKKYLITEKTTEEYKKERWSKLTSFKLYESIKEAEEIINPEDYNDLPWSPPLSKGGFEPHDEVEYYEKNMLDKDELFNDSPEGDSSEETVSVEKPSSSFGTEYKFYKKDFMNESKKYILDLNTMTFVINPNSL